jgi:MoxR-like ATPase
VTIESIDALQAALREQLYIADRGLATSIFLALKLGRPLFLEGEAGVGKTEVAKVVTRLLDTDMIRLQCYEGLDVNHAVYEWNYTRQMLHIRLMAAANIPSRIVRPRISPAAAAVASHREYPCETAGLAGRRDRSQ